MQEEESLPVTRHSPKLHQAQDGGGKEGCERK